MDSEAVFVDDCDSEGDDANINPDSEAEMLSEREKYGRHQIRHAPLWWHLTLW